MLILVDALLPLVEIIVPRLRRRPYVRVAASEYHDICMLYFLFVMFLTAFPFLSFRFLSGYLY